MTPQQVLDKYRHIVVVNGQNIALEISQELQAKPQQEQRAHFGGHHKIGFFYLFVGTKHPNKVLETVVSPQGDAITSVYMVDPIFATTGELLRAREQLIKACAESIGLSVEAVGIEDPARGRLLGLEELGTGQLIDLLAGQLGSTIATTDSVGGSVAVAAEAAK